MPSPYPFWHTRATQVNSVSPVNLDRDEFVAGVKSAFGLTSTAVDYALWKEAGWLGLTTPDPVGWYPLICNVMLMMELGDGPCWLAIENPEALDSPEHNYWHKVRELCELDSPPKTVESLYLKCEKLDKRISPLLFISMMTNRDVALFVERRQIIIGTSGQHKIVTMARTNKDLQFMAEKMWWS